MSFRPHLSNLSAASANNHYLVAGSSISYAEMHVLLSQGSNASHHVLLHTSDSLMPIITACCPVETEAAAAVPVEACVQDSHCQHHQ